MTDRLSKIPQGTAPGISQVGRVDSLRNWLIAVALIGLVLPAVGPLADHHFAERFYHHGHLFLAPEGKEHAHNFGSYHGHYASLSGDFEGSVPQDEVVFLTSTDAAGPGLFFLPAVSVTLDRIFADSSDAPLLLQFSPLNGPPSEFLGTVPKKPPRA